MNSSKFKHNQRTTSSLSSSSSSSSSIIPRAYDSQSVISHEDRGRVSVTSSTIMQRATTPPIAKSNTSTGSVVSRSGKCRHNSKGAAKSSAWSPLEFGTIALTAELYAAQFPGALPLNSTVFAWHFAQHVWHSATIILARPIVREEIKETSVNITESVPTSAFDASSPRVPSRKAQDDSILLTTTPYHWPEEVSNYDYYIHFHSEDRRHDVWVDVTLLKPANFSFKLGDSYRVVDPGPDEIHKHMDSEYLKEHEENTKLKTIGCISIGGYLVETWYFSPYPKEFQNLPILYICQFCLSFFKREAELDLHTAVCPFFYPPGDEIYRDVERGIAMFEVDGTSAKTYTENLCFLSKLFLDHKTLRHPVYLFLFYVLVEMHDDGFRVVGYFSKEKYSKNNLSCIMCLPQHQRKGYGQLLVNMSYALSWREGKRGTPERPLSDLGCAAYVKYWTQTSLDMLLAASSKASNDDGAELSLEDIASATSIEPSDLVMALQTVGILRTLPNRPCTFFFLPNEYHACQIEYSRRTFATCPVSETAMIEIQQLLSNKQPSTTATSAIVKALQEAPIKDRGKKRRRESLKTSESQKRNKTTQSTTAAAMIPKKKNNLALANLSLLRWESYDLHMGPYEHAPASI